MISSSYAIRKTNTASRILSPRIQSKQNEVCSDVASRGCIIKRIPLNGPTTNARHARIYCSNAYASNLRHPQFSPVRRGSCGLRLNVRLCTMHPGTESESVALTDRSSRRQKHCPEHTAHRAPHNAPRDPCFPPPRTIKQEARSSPVREWKRREKPERYLDMGVERQNQREHQGMENVG